MSGQSQIQYFFFENPLKPCYDNRFFFRQINHSLMFGFYIFTLNIWGTIWRALWNFKNPPLKLESVWGIYINATLPRALQSLLMTRPGEKCAACDMTTSEITLSQEAAPCSQEGAQFGCQVYRVAEDFSVQIHRDQVKDGCCLWIVLLVPPQDNLSKNLMNIRELTSRISTTC